jgi:hypothetical protein
MSKPLVWLAGVAVAAAAVLALRAELMTVELEPAAGSRTAFVVQAHTREDPRLLDEMTRGIVSVCRLLVNADVVQRSFRRTGEDRFAFVLEPGLDEFDLREMRGCLQDARVQHLLVDVVAAETAVRRSSSMHAPSRWTGGGQAWG